MSYSYLRFLKELHALLSAGAPIKEALSSLALRGGENSYAARLLRSIEAGNSLSEAVREVVPGAPAEHVAMISAGEDSGTLVELLHRILKEAATQREHRRALLSQVAYPLLILALAVILPPLSLIFAGRTGTYILVQLIVFVPLAALLLLVWLGPRLVPATSSARTSLELFLLGLPFLRQFILDVVLGRTLHVLGMLMEAGLGFSASLPLAGRASGWVTVRRELNRIDYELREGKTTTESFARLPGLPVEYVDRIARGEKEGMISRSFLEVGDALRARYLRRLTVTLRVVPIVAFLAAALIVLLMGLWVLQGAYPW